MRDGHPLFDLPSTTNDFVTSIARESHGASESVPSRYQVAMSERDLESAASRSSSSGTCTSGSIPIKNNNCSPFIKSNKNDNNNNLISSTPSGSTSPVKPSPASPFPPSFSLLRVGIESSLLQKRRMHFQLRHWSRRLLFFSAIFFSWMLFIFLIFYTLPPLQGSSPEIDNGLAKLNGNSLLLKLNGTVLSLPPPAPHLPLHLPKSISEIRALRDAMAQYYALHPLRTLLGFSSLYMFLQTFALPGTSALNLIGGSLFGFVPALSLAILLLTSSAAVAYSLSALLLKDLVSQLFPERLDWLSREVQKNRGSLLNFMLFLRINPLVPSWFINLASPIVSVPLRVFLIGALLGFVPTTSLVVKTGCILAEVRSLRELYGWQNAVVLLLLALLVLLPVLWKKGGKAK